MAARVTIVTPTLPQRHHKLLTACFSVKDQSFADWTHLIIPNGPDPALPVSSGGRVRVLPLGCPHPTPGHWNRVLGGLLADTEFVAYLDDDNAWRPRHLEVLVAALDADPTLGFAYSQMQYADGHVLGDGDLRATGALNHIDASMIVHRTELLADKATWDPQTVPDREAYAMDGILVDRWLALGVTFAFVPEITVDYSGVNYWADGGGATV